MIRSYLVIIDGTFGSTYDNNGVRQPNPVKDEFGFTFLDNSLYL